LCDIMKKVGFEQFALDNLEKFWYNARAMWGQISPKKQKRRPFPQSHAETTAIMKKTLRLIALLMACLFCLMAIVACDDDKDNDGDDEDVETKVEDGVKYAKDEWGRWRLMDELPDELDWRGELVKVLYWSDVEKPEFKQDEETNLDRTSAIYKRNNAIENRLGVELDFTGEPGNANNVQGFVRRVENAKNGGQNDFDIIGTYSKTQGALLGRGFLYNLSSVEDSYLDLEKPWWPGNLVDYFKVGDSLYFVSGDISITAIDEMHCIYFNKDLVNRQFEAEANAAGFTGANAGTELLYSYVYGYKWTLDKMIEMASSYGTDLDSSGDKTVNDAYGMCSIDYCATALYGSANLRQIDPDAQNMLVISDDYTSNRTISLVKELARLFNSDKYFHESAGNYTQPFLRGNALFALQYIELAENDLIANDAVENYGLVPCPLYDDQQVNYYTVIGNAFSIYSIFVDFDDRGDKADTLCMLTAVLEAWASEGYRKTTPVVFELNMQLKYSPTQDETNMCEYVRAGIKFDLGRIFSDIVGYHLDANVIWAAEQDSPWVSYYSPTLGTMETSLATFVEQVRVNFGN